MRLYWMFGTVTGWIDSRERGAKRIRIADALAQSPCGHSVVYLYQGKRLIAVKDLTAYLSKYGEQYEAGRNTRLVPDLLAYYAIDSKAGGRGAKWKQLSKQMEAEVLALLKPKEKKRGKDDGCPGR